MPSFLIDECLSPTLAKLALNRGYHASHVNWLGMAGHGDPSIAKTAVARDCVLITNNGIDFRPLYRRLKLHPGLIVLLPSVDRLAQLRLFMVFLAWVEPTTDLVNALVEIDRASDLTITNWSSNAAA